MTRRLFVAAVLLCLACRAPPVKPPLVVLAASSLTESLQAVGAAWTAHGNPPVTLSFDASSTLAKQVEAGVPADAFFSADTEWMDALDGKGLIDPATRADLVGNTLVVVVPASSTLRVDTTDTLTDPAVRRLALAGEHVPAGRYARAALTHHALWAALSPRVVNGNNVRTVLRWVADGEADAGVVYGTDAAAEPKVKVAYTFSAASHPPIVYPMAVLRHASQADAAANFLAFCQGAEAAAVFTAAGFRALPPD
jgi:molybdate transport system substrate-binding protein